MCTLVLAVLCGAVFVTQRIDPEGETLVGRLVDRVHRPKLTRSQLDAEMAGYYEGIFQLGRQTGGANIPGAGQWQWSWNHWRPIRTFFVQRERADFLSYELKPNQDLRQFGARMITNSACMADQEYPLQAAPGTRRIALVGDSISRGLGADFGRNYEALLEVRLNEEQTYDAARRYEIVNFSCDGYRLTQFVEVVRELTPKYSPDAIVVALTEISVNRLWADHICQLLVEGVDLKYPYLQSLVERSGIQPTDEVPVIEEKLRPYMTECLRWGLTEIRDYANANGIDLLVILVPPVVESELARANMAGVVELVQELDVPILDLLDAYDGIDDLVPYRISDGNRHATNLGQQVLFDQLYDRLQQNPRAWHAITGRN
jgi:hypothetical protein